MSDKPDYAFRAKQQARRNAVRKAFGHEDFLRSIKRLWDTRGSSVAAKHCWHIVEQCDPALARWLRSLGYEGWRILDEDVGEVQRRAGRAAQAEARRELVERKRQAEEGMPHDRLSVAELMAMPIESERFWSLADLALRRDRAIGVCVRQTWPARIAEHATVEQAAVARAALEKLAQRKAASEAAVGASTGTGDGEGTGGRTSNLIPSFEPPDDFMSAMSP